MAWGDLPSLQSVATQGRAGRWGGGLSHQPQHGGGHQGRPQVQVQIAPRPATSLPHLGAGGAGLEGGVVPWCRESLARTAAAPSPIPGEEDGPPREVCVAEGRKGAVRACRAARPTQDGRWAASHPRRPAGLQAEDQAPNLPLEPQGPPPLPWELVPSLWSELGLLLLVAPVPRFLRRRSRCPCSHAERCLLPRPPPPQQLPLELEMCPAPPAE